MTVRRRVILGSIATVLAMASATGLANAGWHTPAAGGTRTGDPEIVLTFDDGPNPATTPKVLDTLKAHGLHAIFFLVGDRLSPDNHVAHDLVRRMIAEGHIVANHTVSHVQLCGVKEETAAAEIDEAAGTITALAGMPLPWFRTPYGAYCKRLEAMLIDRKLTHFYWDIDSQEWRHGNAKRMYGYITSSVNRLQGRAVILMHDTKVATVKALPQILEWIDAENKKRKESVRRQIRVIDPAMLASEMAAPGLVDWLANAGTAAADTLASTVASCLP
jgi:peptidoglycan/xylan/chitin deacetylase (PgdA/CDA1 family)